MTLAVVGKVSIRLAETLAGMAEKFADGLHDLGRARDALGFLTETTFYWTINALGMWLLAWGCGVVHADGSAATFGESCALMGMLGCAIFIPGPPGMLGVFQAGVYAGMTMFYPSSIVTGPGAAFVFLMYASQCLFQIVMGCVGLAMERGGGLRALEEAEGVAAAWSSARSVRPSPQGGRAEIWPHWGPFARRGGMAWTFSKVALYSAFGCSHRRVSRWPRPAPRRSRPYESPYGYERTWNAALRLVRVDNGWKITEKDENNGYLLFEYAAPQSSKATAGSLELVRGRETEALVSVLVQLPKMPHYHEQVILDALASKMRREYGDPPEPRPAPSRREAPDAGANADDD